MDINNNSDVKIVIQFKNSSGTAIDVPLYDFELSFFTFRDNVKKATQINGHLTNCSIVNGKLNIYFNAPNFGKGRVFMRAAFEVPDLNYPDGYRHIEFESPTDHIIV